jgi:hypothetical protein
MPVDVHPLTLKSRNSQLSAELMLTKQEIPESKPLMDPARMPARCAVGTNSMPIPPLPLVREIWKPFKSRVTPSALILIPLGFVTSRLAER